MLRPVTVSVNSEDNPPTISVVVKKSPDSDDVSNLCSKSVDALSSVGKNICDAFEQDGEKNGRAQRSHF